MGSKLEPLVLEHFHDKEDHVTVIDHRRHMFDLYFCEGCEYCEICEEEDREHAKHLLNLSKIQKDLERKVGK